MGRRPEQLGPIGGALVRWFVDRRGVVGGAERRSAFGVLEGAVSIVLNTVLFAIKLGIGLHTGSIALLADAVHTFADSVTSLVVIVSSYVSRKPPDDEHPFGHGRAEAVATVTIAVLLGVAAFEFGKESVLRIAQPGVAAASWAIIGAVAATALVKEWMARFSFALGRASGSTTLRADGWHHRSDVFATGLVVVAMVAGRFGWALVDGVMGLGVSLLLLKVAIDVARSAIDTLLGPAPSEEEILTLKESALRVEGVRGVHDIVVHRYGDLRFVSLHIETSDRESPATLHTIAERVEQAVNDGRHGSVCVHVDPVNDRHPDYDAVQRIVTEVVAADERLESFHDLRLPSRGDGYVVALDLNLTSGCGDGDAAAAALREQLRRRSAAMDVYIEIEPKYSYQR